MEIKEPIKTAPTSTAFLRFFGFVYAGLAGLLHQEHAASRYRSRWWFILPFTFNLPGGVVAYMAIRHDDPDKAKSCLLLGIIILGIMLVPWLILIGLAPEASFSVD